MNQRPAYLQNIGTPDLAERAAEGIGSSRPPHLVTGNNAFVLVDAAGNEQRAQTTFLDVCIADVSDVMCKMYYGDENGPKKWAPDSTDAPACWSANGVAPSADAISPQSARCDSCRWNRRGEGGAVSMDGKPTKACRDEKWFAFLIAGVQFPIQYRLTPGSFTNFRAYTEVFKGKAINMSQVFTRLAFEPDTNGVLTFAVSPTGYIDEGTAGLYLKVKEAKAADVLVGRTDRPRQVAISDNRRETVLSDGTVVAKVIEQQAQPQGFQPAPFGAGTAAPQANQASTAGGALQATTQGNQRGTQSEAPRRRRRTADQIKADEAAAAGGGALPGAAAFGSPAAGGQTAPFAQPQQAAQGGAFGAAPATAQQGTFGIQNNAPPPPSELDSALDQLFKGQ